MSADTHTSSAGGDTDMEDLDIGSELPGHVKTIATRTEEEMLLKHMLGIDLHDSEKQIAAKVFEVVSRVREDLDEHHFTEQLEKKLTAAFRRINYHDPEHHGAVESHDILKIRAIADAVKESIPADVLYEIFRTQSSVLDKDAVVPPDTVRENIGTLGEVSVDLSHPFWKGKKKFTVHELEHEFTTKELKSIGISIPGRSPKYKLTLAEAQAIAATNFGIVSPDNGYGKFEETITDHTGLVGMYSVDIDALISAETTNDAPAANLQNLRIGSCDAAQLTSLLLFEVNGEYPYWNLLVRSPANSSPHHLVPATGTPPAPVAAYIASEVFGYLGKDRMRPIAGENIQLHALHSKMVDSTDNQDRTALYEGSDNPMGAAIAYGLMNKHPDLKNLLKVNHDTKKSKKEIGVLRQKKNLSDLIQKIPAGLTVTSALSRRQAQDIPGQVSAETTKLDAAIQSARIAAAGSKTYPPVSLTVNGKTVGPFDPLSPRADRAIQWLEAQQEEAEKASKEYVKIEGHVKAVAETLFLLNEKEAKKMDIVQLFKFTPAVPASPATATTPAIPATPATVTIDDTKWVSGLNVNSMLAKIKTIADFDVQEPSKIQDEIDKKEKALKDAKNAKGPIGDNAQFFIVKEYFKKYKGMTDVDAKKAANYLLVRSTLDEEVSQTAEELIESVYGHDPDRGDQFWNWWENTGNFSFDAERRSRRIVYQVAKAAGVTVGSDQDSWGVRWESAKYPALLKAYFSIKKLAEGEGPAAIRLQNTKYVKAQLKELSKAIFSKNIEDMAQYLGPDAAEAVRKFPTKEEKRKMFKKLLEGDAPAKKADEIHHIIERADQKTDFWRRKVAPWSWKAPTYAAVGTAKTGYKVVKGVYYDAPKWAITNTYDKVAKPTINVIKKRGKAVFLGALIGTFVFPGVGTAVGTAVGSVWKTKTDAGHASDHGHGHGHGH